MDSQVDLIEQSQKMQECEFNSYNHYNSVICKTRTASLHDLLNMDSIARILNPSIEIPKISKWIHISPNSNFKIKSTQQKFLTIITFILETNHIKYRFNINENNYIFNPNWFTLQAPAGSPVADCNLENISTSYNDIHFYCTMYIKSEQINFIIRPFLDTDHDMFSSKGPSEYTIDFQRTSGCSLTFYNVLYDFKEILIKKLEEPLDFKRRDVSISDPEYNNESYVLNMFKKQDTLVFSYNNFTSIESTDESFAFSKAWLLSDYTEESTVMLKTCCSDILELENTVQSTGANYKNTEEKLKTKLIRLLYDKDVIKQLIKYINTNYYELFRLSFMVLTFLIEQKSEDSDMYDLIYTELYSDEICKKILLYLNSEDIFMHNLILKLAYLIPKKFTNKQNGFISICFKLQQKFPKFADKLVEIIRAC